MPSALSATSRQAGWIELHASDLGERLRLFNRACTVEQGTAILVAEATAPAPAGAPYARLWDRTEELAAALDAWKAGLALFPALRPGELIRLPV